MTVSTSLSILFSEGMVWYILIIEGGRQRYKNHPLQKDSLICKFVTKSPFGKKEEWVKGNPWWRHDMETHPVLLPLCAGKPSVMTGFPSQKVGNADPWWFVVVRLTDLCIKQLSFLWFSMIWDALSLMWRHYTALPCLSGAICQDAKDGEAKRDGVIWSEDQHCGRQAGRVSS